MRSTFTPLAALVIIAVVGSVCGFAPNPPGRRVAASRASTSLLASGNNLDNDDTSLSSLPRRDFVVSHLGIMTLLLASSATTSNAADDTIDYSYLQDLLGKPDSSKPLTQTYVPKGSRPTYLVDPTEEFKANEAKAMDFKRAQIEQKKSFLAALEKFESDPNDEKLLSGGLDSLRKMVRAQSGLPLGVTKDELVKRIRRRKAKRYWTTGIEIAYQDLLDEIRYQQSPNTEKDSDNPF
jgi:hypothetical protein